jgi:hypothetical protein
MIQPQLEQNKERHKTDLLHSNDVIQNHAYSFPLMKLTATI